jgi:hypothetical protein
VSAALELTDEQMRDVLAKATREICDGAVKSATTSLAHSIEWSAKETMQAEIAAFLKEHVVPQMQEQLLVQKSAIIEAAVLAAHDCAEMLRASMVTELTKRLSDDYKRREIFKAMFGDRY